MLNVRRVCAASSGTDLRSPCIAADTTEKWRHANRDYTVSGSQTALASRFDACYKDTLKVVTTLQPLKIKEISSKTFCDISYFYDAGIDASLVRKWTNSTVYIVTHPCNTIIFE